MKSLRVYRESLALRELAPEGRVGVWMRFQRQKSVHHALSFIPHRKFSSAKVATIKTVSGIHVWPDFPVRSNSLLSDSPQMASHSISVLRLPRFAPRMHGGAADAYESGAWQCSAGFFCNVRLEGQGKGKSAVPTLAGNDRSGIKELGSVFSQLPKGRSFGQGDGNP